MTKKGAAAVGLLAAGVAVGALIVSASKAKAVQLGPVQVSLLSNPVQAYIAVDGVEVETPAVITLMPGVHTFAAPPKSQDLMVTYGFNEWTVDGQVVSYGAVAQIAIAGPCTVKAEYMMINAGIATIATNNTPT